MTGKEVRLSRLKDSRSGRFFILPMDHGISTWPLQGLESIAAAVNGVGRARATALLVHKGQVPQVVPAVTSSRRPGLIVQLSGASCRGQDEHYKRTVGTVEHALKLGADAVSFQVNVGNHAEGDMLEELGHIAEDCHAWGVPLLAMMYVRGPAAQEGWEPVAHAARIAAELGADLVKTSYTGSIDTFRQVTRAVRVPVVIGGGPRIDSDQQLLQTLRESMLAGAVGACIGRNIFQHDQPAAIAEAAALVIHDDHAADAALELALAELARRAVESSVLQPPRGR